MMSMLAIAIIAWWHICLPLSIILIAFCILIIVVNAIDY
jgi:hypothetical protein